MEEQVYRGIYENEDAHWWFRGRRAVAWSMLRRAGLPEQPRILDAGCGTGRNIVEFGPLGSVRGIDPSADAIEFCRRRGLQDVQRARIEELPFEDDSFDLIIATDVLEHLPDDHRALVELRRVAAPGARMLITVPAYQWMWSYLDESHHHFRRYTSTRLRTQVTAGGWRPLVQTYFNSLLLAPIAAVRLLGRRGSEARRREDMELTPGGLNVALEQPMRLEAALIGRGVRLPAGVSVGMVCTPA